MLSKSFWKGAAERAVKGFFQTFVAVALAGVGADAIGITAGIGDVSWVNALSVAALAVVLSVATSLGNADFTAGKPLETATVVFTSPTTSGDTDQHDVVNEPITGTTATDDEPPRHLRQ